MWKLCRTDRPLRNGPRYRRTILCSTGRGQSQLSGTRNLGWQRDSLQAFAGDGYDIAAAGSEVVALTDNPAIGPYHLSLIHVQDAVSMLTWAQPPRCK